MTGPLVACRILPWLLVNDGLPIVRRGMICVDLALAQVAALGNCVAILLGHDSHDWQMYAWSVGFTIVDAVISGSYSSHPTICSANRLAGGWAFFSQFRMVSAVTPNSSARSDWNR